MNMKMLVTAVLGAGLVPTLSGLTLAQVNARPLYARHLAAIAGVKIFNPAGTVRIIGWAHDSIVVRGAVARHEKFFAVGSDSGIKLGVDEHVGVSSPRPCEFTIYVPRHARVYVKTVSADVTASDVSGWFYSVSGAFRLSGEATSLDVQTMRGDVDLNVSTPWARVRSGDGHLLVRGSPQDIDASTVGGALDVATSSVLRGQFGSVLGSVRYDGTPAAGAVLDFWSHAGDIDLALPRTTSGVFALSSITGTIENDLGGVQPAAAARSVRVTLGRGEARVTVRTFKGTVRLRPR